VPVIIRFLIADAYSVGGTIRTTFVTAGQLAREHEVEVVSVYRFAERPRLELDPRVQLRCLTDLTPQSRQGLRGRIAESPSRVIHSEDTRYPRFNLLTDAALLPFLYSVRDGVLVGTRPALNLAIARHVSRRVVRIGQDHMNLDSYEPGLVSALAERYPKLDAVTALTEGTAAQYRELMGQRGRVVCIPNPAPSVGGRRASLDAPVVVAAGSLTRRKGFDRLLEAWAGLAPRFPDWRLKIFGTGPMGPELEALIDKLGIRGSARLCGHSPRMLDELASASVFAFTSRSEGFPMVLLEAMAVGLPVVAYDCPTGPSDIITDGVDGHVIPNGRTRLFVEALGGLMEDERRRRQFSTAALESVTRYRIGAIGARWEALFGELAAGRGGSRGLRHGDATARAPV
jgi:glycosyltransferase involved in cell wall biosynthesis